MRKSSVLALLMTSWLAAQGGPVGDSSGVADVSFGNVLPNLLELAPLAKRLGGGAFFSVFDPNEGHLKSVERDGRKEFLVFEGASPGLLGRIQSARRFGRLRIYVDGGNEAVVDEELDELLSGRVSWALAPFAAVEAGVGEIHLPIPYAKSLVVTVDDARARVVVSGRTFPPGTAVTSFTRAELEEHLPEIERLGRMLLDHQRFHLPMMNDFKRSPHVLKPKSATVVFEDNAESGAAISWLSFESSTLMAEVRRRVILRCTFDGVTTVIVPLGDFHGAFGQGVGYQSAPVGTDERGLLCSRWVMPYRKSVRIELFNHLPQEVTMEVGVGVRALPFTPESHYFHAAWRRVVSSKSSNELAISLPMSGPGTFVGCAILPHMATRWPWSHGRFALTSSSGAGPASSIVAVALADWMGFLNTKERFSTQLYGAPGREGVGVLGRTLGYRWLTLDAIPFETSLSASLGLNAADPGASLATVFCWYGPATAQGELNVEDLVVAEPVRTEPDRKITDAIEVEGLLESARTGPPPEVIAVRGASQDEVLRWVATEHHRMTLAVEIATAGAFRLTLFARRDLEGGPVQVAWDGVDVGVLDTSGKIGEEAELSFDVTLSAGRHTLELRRAATATATAVVVPLDALTLTAR